MEVKVCYIITPMNQSEKPRFGLEDVQRSLKRRDDTLPDELKQQFPVMTYEEIREKYPDSWLAFQFSKAGLGGGFATGAEGRVYGSSRYIDDVKDIVDDISIKYPEIEGILRSQYSEPSVPKIVRRDSLNYDI